VVTRPEHPGFQFCIWDPFQVTFIVLLQFPIEYLCFKNEDVPVIPFVGREHQQSAQLRILDIQPGFFAHFASNTLFQRLARFELAAQSIPLAQVDVVRPLGAVEHQGLLIVLEVAKSGEY
jgi:hypothetical protein